MTRIFAIRSIKSDFPTIPPRMKTVLLLLSLFGAASSIHAQGIATNYAPNTENSGFDSPVAVASPNTLASTSPNSTDGARAKKLAALLETTPYESTSTHASARVNGVIVQVQTMVSSGTVLISFSMPPQRSQGVLELVNARTGQALYAGSILLNQGQIELPVSDINQPFEVRLGTDHELVIARMAN